MDNSALCSVIGLEPRGLRAAVTCIINCAEDEDVPELLVARKPAIKAGVANVPRLNFSKVEPQRQRHEWLTPRTLEGRQRHAWLTPRTLDSRKYSQTPRW